MFNGRNSFNGFTTEKPVCVLRLDSAGTEVKRKNPTLEIPHKSLIPQAFIHLTEPESADPEGRWTASFFAYFLQLTSAPFTPERTSSLPGAYPRNGKRSSIQLFTSRPLFQSQGLLFDSRT
jgi:hypothetical protein